MLYFKSCPRCRGDVCTQDDEFGPFLLCLQCRMTRELAAEGVLWTQAGWTARPAPLAAHS